MFNNLYLLLTKKSYAICRTNLLSLYTYIKVHMYICIIHYAPFVNYMHFLPPINKKYKTIY